MNILFANIFATVIGGLLLALVFFSIKEYFFSIPNLVGNWIFEIVTARSDYNPYRGMLLRYYVLLWQEGNQIKGTGEKIYEKTSEHEQEYVGDKRSRIEINGYLTKKYFSKDLILIHYDEENEVRKSSTIHNLSIKDTSTMNGFFVSTIANQQGQSTWTRRTSA